MLPHSWMLKCLDNFEIADKSKLFHNNIMKYWEISGGEILGKVKIKQ